MPSSCVGKPSQVPHKTWLPRDTDQQRWYYDTLTSQLRTLATELRLWADLLHFLADLGGTHTDHGSSMAAVLRQTTLVRRQSAAKPPSDNIKSYLVRSKNVAYPP